MSAFRFERFTFAAEVLDNLELPPYKGGSLRGAMGEVMRRAVCVRSRSACTSCGESGCLCRLIFEPTDERGKTVPAPYVLEPPADDRTVIPRGEAFRFGLVLVGQGLTHLPFIIMVLDEAGRAGIGRTRGRYRLREVSADGRMVYEDGRLRSLPGGKALDDVPAPPDGDVCVEFVTAVHLRREGVLVEPTDFSALFGSVYRRTKLLARYHSEERLHEDAAVKDAAARVALEQSEVRRVTVSRLSRTQGRMLDYDGYLGTAVFADLPPEVGRLLGVGEYLHVGHGCTFGLGRYRVSPANTTHVI